MKIDNTSQPLKNSVQKVETTPPVPTDSAAEQAKRTTKSTDKIERSRQLLLRWFTQVGIQESEEGLSELELVKRASRREHILSSNRMRNLQHVLDHALSVNIEVSNKESLDPDWFFSFAKFAEDIHSPAMQSLWGRIIAVEISQPGSFSLRTLSLLKQLTQRDAKVFSKVASIASRKKSDPTPRILVGYYQKPTLLSWLSGPANPHLNLAQFGITYPDLLALIDTGLIFASEIETGELDPERREQWRCQDAKFSLSPKRGSTALIYYKFTSVGSELYRLVSKQPRSDYVEQLLALLNVAFDISRE